VFLAGYNGRISAVGESFHRDALIRAVGGERPGGRAVLLTVALVPEPDNPDDRNAIAVAVGGETVAHLPRDAALEFRPVFDRLRQRGWSAHCEAFIGGGSDGLHLDEAASLMTAMPAVDREDRPYARTTCPSCCAALVRLPKARALCPSCREPIHVRSGPDNRRHLVREIDLEMFESAWGARDEGREQEALGILARLDDEAASA
jgi:hypothetical protein